MKKMTLLPLVMLILAACGGTPSSSSESSIASSTSTSTSTSSVTTSTTTSVSSSVSSEDPGPVITTIQNARLLSEGADVTIQGVVTRLIRQRNFYVQEGNFGITVFGYEGTEEVSVGDYVQIYGFIGVYYGLVQLTGAAGSGLPEVTFLSGTAPVITPLVLTEETYDNATLAPNNDGRLVRIEGLKLKNAWVPLLLDPALPTAGGVNVDMLLGAKTVLARFDRYISIVERTALNTLFGSLSNADTVTYTGVLGDFNGIQLAVSARSDFELVDQPDIDVTSVTVSSAGDVTELVEGLTLQLTATVLPANADNPAVTWSTSDAAVATISASTGLVTAVAAGTVTLTATSVASPSIFGTFALTVVEPPLTLQEVVITNTEVSLGITKTLQITVDYLPVGFPATGVTYSSSNNAIATVSSTGLVTGVAVGPVVITATSIDDVTLSDTLSLEIVELVNINTSANLVETLEVAAPFRIEEAYVISHLAYTQNQLGVTVNGSTMILGTPSGVVALDYFSIAGSQNTDLLALVRAIAPGSYVSASGTINTGTGGDFARNRRVLLNPVTVDADLVVSSNASWFFGELAAPTNALDMNQLKAWIDDPARSHNDLGKFFVITNVRFNSVGSSSPSATGYDYFNYGALNLGVNTIGASTTAYVRVGLYKAERLDSTVYNTTDIYTVVGYIGGANADFTTGFVSGTPILRVLYYSSIVKTSV
jgi:hypothetical protein